MTALLYWVVTSASDSIPNEEQIVAGNNGDNTTAISFGYDTETTNVEIVGLSANTEYRLSIVWYNGIDVYPDGYSNILHETFTTDLSGGLVPTLSGTTLISTGTTYGTPRVTITFA